MIKPIIFTILLVKLSFFLTGYVHCYLKTGGSCTYYGFINTETMSLIKYFAKEYVDQEKKQKGVCHASI